MAPKQSNLAVEMTGNIILSSGHNFEQALKDLEGFEHIWVLYWFHKATGWKAKVSTPRGGPKRGVFATRSPHRPNPIGLSAVKLIEIKGRTITIGKSDMIDGTPILDIKPYIAYADAYPRSKQGWLGDEGEGCHYQVTFSAPAIKQLDFIQQQWDFPLKDTAILRFGTHPHPLKNNRIKELKDGNFVLAIKTWRIIFTVKEQRVRVQQIISGYDSETLSGKKASRWNDVPLHQAFLQKFPSIQEKADRVK